MWLRLQRPVSFIEFPCSKTKSDRLAVHLGPRLVTAAHLRLVRPLLLLLGRYLTRCVCQRARSRTQTRTFTAPTSTRHFLKILYHLAYRNIAAVLISLLNSASNTLLSFLSSLLRSLLSWAVGSITTSSWRRLACFPYQHIPSYERRNTTHRAFSAC